MVKPAAVGGHAQRRASDGPLGGLQIAVVLALLIAALTLVAQRLPNDRQSGSSRWGKRGANPHLASPVDVRVGLVERLPGA